MTLEVLPIIEGDFRTEGCAQAFATVARILYEDACRYGVPLLAKGFAPFARDEALLEERARRGHPQMLGLKLRQRDVMLREVFTVVSRDHERGVQRFDGRAAGSAVTTDRTYSSLHARDAVRARSTHHVKTWMGVLCRNGPKRRHLRGRFEFDVLVVYVHDLVATSSAVVVKRDFLAGISEVDVRAARKTTAACTDVPLIDLMLHRRERHGTRRVRGLAVQELRRNAETCDDALFGLSEIRPERLLMFCGELRHCFLQLFANIRVGAHQLAGPCVGRNRGSVNQPLQTMLR